MEGRKSTLRLHTRQSYDAILTWFDILDLLGGNINMETNQNIFTYSVSEFTGREPFYANCNEAIASDDDWEDHVDWQNFIESLPAIG